MRAATPTRFGLHAVVPVRRGERGGAWSGRVRTLTALVCAYTAPRVNGSRRLKTRCREYEWEIIKYFDSLIYREDVINECAPRTSSVARTARRHSRQADRPTDGPTVDRFFFSFRLGRVAAAVRSRRRGLRPGNYRARALSPPRWRGRHSRRTQISWRLTDAAGAAHDVLRFFSPFPVFLCPRTMLSRSLVRYIYIFYFFLLFVILLLFISTRTGYHVCYVITITILRRAHVISCVISCTS